MKSNHRAVYTENPEDAVQEALGQTGTTWQWVCKCDRFKTGFAKKAWAQFDFRQHKRIQDFAAKLRASSAARDAAEIEFTRVDTKAGE
jgi:hypothetical protein